MQGLSFKGGMDVAFPTQKKKDMFQDE
jgi:hypothetical protein